MKKGVVFVTAILLAQFACTDQNISEKKESLTPPAEAKESAVLSPNIFEDGYHWMPGLSNQAEGAGIAAADINGNGIVDLIFIANDIGNPENQLRYYVAYDLGTDGEPAYNAPRIDVPGSSLGNAAQGAGIALGDINRNGVLDLLVMHYDVGSGLNDFRFKIGWDIDNDGKTNSWSTLPSITGNENEAQGAGIALEDFDGNGILDLFLMSYNNPSGKNDFRYKIGLNLSTSGSPTSWSSMKSVNGVGEAADGAACGVTRYNQSSGYGVNVLLMAYDDPAGANTFRYIVGCNMVSTGDLTCGWYPARADVVNYLTVDGLGSEGNGAGMTFADVDRNGLLDVIFMAYDARTGGNTFRYRVGFNIQRTAYPPTTDWR